MKPTKKGSAEISIALGFVALTFVAVVLWIIHFGTPYLLGSPGPGFPTTQQSIGSDLETSDHYTHTINAINFLKAKSKNGKPMADEIRELHKAATAMDQNRLNEQISTVKEATWKYFADAYPERCASISLKDTAKLSAFNRIGWELANTEGCAKEKGTVDNAKYSIGLLIPTEDPATQIIFTQKVAS